MDRALALILPTAPTPNYGVPQMLRAANARSDKPIMVNLSLRGRNAIKFEVIEIGHDSIIGQEISEHGKNWLDIIPFHAIDRIRISK